MWGLDIVNFIWWVGVGATAGTFDLGAGCFLKRTALAHDNLSAAWAEAMTVLLP